MENEDAKNYYHLQRNINKKISILDFIESQLNECLASEEIDEEAIQTYRKQLKEVALDLKNEIQKLPIHEQEEYQPMIHAYLSED